MVDAFTIGTAAVTAATTAGISEMTKQAVNRSMEKISNHSGKIDKGLTENFEVLGKEIIIQCPECIQKYSISLVAKKIPRIFAKKEFKFGRVRRVSLRQLRSMQIIPDSITTDTEGFIVDMSTLQEGEEYLLDVEYEIPDKTFVDSLVDRRHAVEPRTEEEPEYWLAAQLKYPDVLQRSYGRVDIRDIDLSIDVAVHQTINMKVPKQFKDNLETIARLTKPRGRDATFRDYNKLIHLHKQRYSGKETDILASLQDYFLPSHFKGYVDVRNDFYYSSCERGIDWYDNLPFPTWPKFMTVTTRSDLTLEKCAANGALIYKKKNLIDEIEKLFK